MSVGRAQRGRTATANRDSLGPNGTSKLLTMTGHTIHLRARGALIWSAALGALGALFVALYPSISGSGASIEQMMSSMPAAMRDMIGYGGDAFSSVEGWLAGEMLSFLVPLALSFFPILVASSAIAGAEENGTMDMLLGNPLSRSQFALARFAAAAILLLGIVTLMGAVTWLTGIIVDVDLGLGSMAAASLSLWSLCIFFGGIALLLSAALHRRFLALAIPATLLILMYFVDGLASSVELFDAIKPLSAFNYYGSAIQNGMDWTGFGVLAGATAALVSVALLIFLRRDIYS